MEPLYEFKDESPSFKILILVTGIMFFAMAVFMPWPDDASLLLVWGMRAFFVIFGVMMLLISPVVRLRAWSDSMEIRFGPTKLISFMLDIGKITDIRAVEYNPMKDFGGWGIKGGTGKWKGWMAYTATQTNRALSIETTEKNYLISCPNPEEAETSLRNIVGLK